MNEASINNQQMLWFKSTLTNGYVYLSKFSYAYITPIARQAFDTMTQ
jgi:hypothetical protein